MSESCPWPEFQRFKSLYSASPVERFEASMRYGEEYPKQNFVWPYGCWGAANAWLVLLGPSPGKPFKGDVRVAGEENRLWDQYPKIGKDVCQIQFRDSVRRNPKWKSVSRAGFGSNCEPKLSEKLTALLNLDGGNAKYGRNIDPQYLKSGCEVVFERLQEARPRVIIALSYAAWNPFTEFLASKNLVNLAPPPVYPNGRALLAKKLKIDSESEFETFIIKSRQHPSMPFFKAGSDDDAVKLTVDWFLASHNKS